MRLRIGFPLALLTILACSDTNGPGGSSAPALEAGTYDMTLTACEMCTDASGSSFAVVFREGVATRVEVTEVTESKARIEFTRLETAVGTDLLGALESTVVEFAPVAGAYSGTVGYLQGAISLTLTLDGCLFSLEYPGVNTGGGSCRLE